jgi:hypothetical protein
MIRSEKLFWMPFLLKLEVVDETWRSPSEEKWGGLVMVAQWDLDGITNFELYGALS